MERFYLCALLIKLMQRHVKVGVTTAGFFFGLFRFFFSAVSHGLKKLFMEIDTLQI